MALASTSDNFGQFTNDSSENVKKAAAISTSDTSHTSSTSTNQLNFYESMYHFRKMFPNVDSDVIECVLRSNSGAIDKTIDHLLTMNHHHNDVISHHDENELKPINNNLNNLDMPPSYTEFMSSKVLTESSNIATVVDLNVDTNKSEKKFQDLVQDDAISTLINVTNEKTIINSCSRRNTDEFIAKFNKIVIGELAKDFLRVKLTSDQVKKIKCSIKKAKRSEIAAILNNKEPDKPDLSFEMRKRLNILNEQVADDIVDDCGEPWRQRYQEVSKSYERKRQQMLQDEYLAKLMQNEEFLNELKTDKDFIQTLNYESSNQIANEKQTSLPQFDNYYNYDNRDKRLSNLQPGSQNHLNWPSTHTELTNAELRTKLLHMGKISQMKLTKLAAKFSTKAKSTYNKALDQTTSTCTSLFSSFTPLDNYTNNKYNSSDSYYVSNERKKSNVDDCNEETYDVERIKFEEMMSNVPNSNTSRYKKIYKSFKSTMRRNSSASNSSSSTSSMNNSSKLTTSSTSPQYLLNTEHNLFSDVADNKFTSNGLNVFQNGYGYNDTNENYFYDNSVYPCVKTVSANNGALSKTSKKILDNMKLHQK